MPLPKLDANSLAGIQCAADSYNSEKAVAMAQDGLPETSATPLSPADYWDLVYSKVSKDDSRPESEVLAAALLSYQSQFDVGLGTAGVAALLVEKAQQTQGELALTAAAGLKAAYETEARTKGAMK